MNNQIRALEITASMLGLAHIAKHLRAARLHESNRSYHLSQAWELATEDYFGGELADEIQMVAYEVVA